VGILHASLTLEDLGAVVLTQSDSTPAIKAHASKHGLAVKDNKKRKSAIGSEHTSNDENGVEPRSPPLRVMPDQKLKTHAAVEKGSLSPDALCVRPPGQLKRSRDRTVTPQTADNRSHSRAPSVNRQPPASRPASGRDVDLHGREDGSDAGSISHSGSGLLAQLWDAAEEEAEQSGKTADAAELLIALGPAGMSPTPLPPLLRPLSASRSCTSANESCDRGCSSGNIPDDGSCEGPGDLTEEIPYCSPVSQRSGTVEVPPSKTPMMSASGDMAAEDATAGATATPVAVAASLSVPEIMSDNCPTSSCGSKQQPAADTASPVSACTYSPPHLVPPTLQDISVPEGTQSAQSAATATQIIATHQVIDAQSEWSRTGSPHSVDAVEAPIESIQQEAQRLQASSTTEAALKTPTKRRSPAVHMPGRCCAITAALQAPPSVHTPCDPVHEVVASNRQAVEAKGQAVATTQKATAAAAGEAATREASQQEVEKAKAQRRVQFLAAWRLQSWRTAQEEAFLTKLQACPSNWHAVHNLCSGTAGRLMARHLKINFS
jgi:hypothetical protein